MLLTSSIRNIPLSCNGKQVPGKLIQVSSVLQLPLDTAWEELQKGELLRYVSSPLSSFGKLPERWSVGEVETCVKAKLFRIIPLPIQDPYSVHFTKIDSSSYTAQTHERSPSIPLWNHTMQMQDQGAGTTRYTDTIELYAGLLTGILSRHVKILYQHRHTRWQEVARILNSGGNMEDEYKKIPRLN